MARTCTVPGCDNKHDSHGFCGKHAHKFRSYGDPTFCSPNYTARGTIAAWLHAHVDYDGEDCLIWPFTRGKDGRASGVIQPTRTMCRLAHGDAHGPNLEAAHSCGRGNMGCIHPKHLRWATRIENERDKIAHGTRVCGSRHGISKLTEADIPIIREMIVKGRRQQSIADRFGVSRITIYRVQNGTTWSQVP